MKDYKLSEIKQMCLDNMGQCGNCPLSERRADGKSLCELMFDTVAPKDWDYLDI